MLLDPHPHGPPQQTPNSIMADGEVEVMAGGELPLEAVLAACKAMPPQELEELHQRMAKLVVRLCPRATACSRAGLPHGFPQWLPHLCTTRHPASSP